MTNEIKPRIKDENDYSKADILQILAETTLGLQMSYNNITAMGNRIDSIDNAMQQNNQQIDSMNKKVSKIEDTKRVSYGCYNSLKKAVKLRCFSVLEITKTDGHITKDSMHDYKTYFGKFCRKCYHDAHNSSHMGHPATETLQKDYEAVIEYISKWEPEIKYEGLTGVEGYKKYLDDLADS